MGTLANSEHPDEMPPNAAFHQGLHCLLRQIRSSEKEIKKKNLTCDPSIYIMDHPDFLHTWCFMENSTDIKRVIKVINAYLGNFYILF